MRRDAGRAAAVPKRLLLFWGRPEKPSWKRLAGFYERNTGSEEPSGWYAEARQSMVEAGESEYSSVLKTRNLLISRDAQNALASEKALNSNVTGTRFLLFDARFFSQTLLLTSG
jgi:hypothetical protein